jgi:putative hydrolase of the HAD superfamily
LKRKAAIFDLDDTLYLESDYLFAAYRAIGEIAQARTGAPSDEAFGFLRDGFRAGGRKDLFDRLVLFFALPADFIVEALEILRTHRLSEPLKMNPRARRVIESELRAGRACFVLTNGNVRQQRNKIAQIDWRGIESSLVFHFADETARKPSPAGVHRILAEHGYAPSEVILVGDSADDAECARRAGVHFCCAHADGEIQLPEDE